MKSCAACFCLESQRTPYSFYPILSRALALFLGGFTLVNLLGELRVPGFDANLWWIDLRWLPVWSVRIALALAAALLLAYGIGPQPGNQRRRWTIGAVVLLMAVAMANGAVFYALLLSGQIHSAVPVPFSFFIAWALWMVWQHLKQSPSSPVGIRSLLPVAAILGALLALFPLAQEFCFGKTDYRRPADAIVVFGARAYADGTPSDALGDRVRTACELYREGLARKIVFSGGPGDGLIHETEAMRRMALSLGVPDTAILLDAAGLSTQATVRNTKVIFDRHDIKRALAVSHFYHLPRIKLAYQRAGVEVCTVPARESYFLRQTPWSMAREVVALWVYYLRPLA